MSTATPSYKGHRATRRSGGGAASSGRPTPTSCGGARAPATSATLTRCSSGSTAGCATCGARSTSTATCSTSSCSHAETRCRPGDSSASCSRACGTCRATDKLGIYQVAHRKLMSSVEHRRSRYLNNRAKNSYQPTRQRERAMKRFKSLRHAQRFLSACSGISAHFRPRRHLLSATEWRTEMADRFAVWRQVTAPDTAA